MREAIFFFFFLSLSFGFGIQFCVVFLFLSFKQRRFREVCAQRECARAEEEFLGVLLLLFSDIYIFVYKREKERERKKLDVDDVCLGERDLLWL